MITLLADSAPPALQWWQVASGILGIPTAVIALVYSYMQIRKAQVDIEKTRVETARLEQELSTQQSELNEQKQQLDDVTVFLFNNFINDAEVRHLEGLESPQAYPFEMKGYSEDQLRHLRDSRLIVVYGTVGSLPKSMPDLHQHASLSAAGKYYLKRRRSLKPAPAA